MSILDEPMFPRGATDCVDLVTGGGVHFPAQPGKSARIYAAIHLCVPMSGDEELDAMIRTAQRQRLAGMIVGTMIHMSTTGDGGWDTSTVVAGTGNLADALLAQLEKP